MAEATWTTSRRRGGLGKNKHCHDENHRAGGGWVFFKRLHVKCGLRDFWEVAWVAGWVLGSGSGRAAQKQDLDCFSSCFAVLVFEFLSSSANRCRFAVELESLGGLFLLPAQATQVDKKEK